MDYCFDLIKMQASSSCLARSSCPGWVKITEDYDSPIGYDVLADAIDRHAG